jgi:1-acyl-sn-glycerol-3-phosphate acyltransferase
MPSIIMGTGEKGVDEPELFESYSPPFAHHLFHALDRTGELLHVDIAGIENLPGGRALLVTNHAFGLDAAFLMARIEALTGRRVWVLGEHAWWRLPGLRRLAAAAGTVDGTQENADRLLSADELVLVLPGGLREALKPRELRYRLLWGRRYGFVRAAVRNRAPIVPIASLGADDLFDLVGNAFKRASRFHLPFPLPRAAHLLPIPHFAHLRYVIGEPIPTITPETPDDDEHRVRRLRREVEGALHEIFEARLAAQVDFPDGSSNVEMTDASRRS